MSWLFIGCGFLFAAAIRRGEPFTLGLASFLLLVGFIIRAQIENELRKGGRDDRP